MVRVWIGPGQQQQRPTHPNSTVANAGTLEWSASFGSATGTATAPVVLLVLADSDDTGLDVVAKALLVASAPGTSPNAFYRDSDRGGSDTPLDGELGLGDDNTVISRFLRSVDEIALNDNDNPASFNLGAYFTSGGDGEDLTLYFQTMADGEISFSASAQFATGGGNFIRFTLPADAQDLLDNIATGDRFIFKAARAEAGDPFDGDAGTLEWSAGFGTATGTTTAPDAMEFDGDAGALEWSVSFGTATGTAGTEPVAATGDLWACGFSPNAIYQRTGGVWQDWH